MIGSLKFSPLLESTLKMQRLLHSKFHSKLSLNKKVTQPNEHSRRQHKPQSTSLSRI